ncbi:hypothetical protein AB5N19_00127 [Seiridium cardinale]
MRFIRDFSTAVVTALLATSAVGELTQVIRSNNLPAGIDNRGLFGAKKLGDGPDIDYKKTKDLCSKAWTKGDSVDLDDKRDLEARARPNNAIEVAPGDGKGAKSSDGPLWSEGFGTCAGIAVTGTPKKQGDDNRYLYHITTFDMDSVQDQYNKLSKAIYNTGLSVTKIWLYTVDTRHANPELNDDDNEGLKDMSDEEEKVFSWIYDGLRDIGNTERRFHPWGKVGEATVPATGNPTFDPNN